MAETNEGLTVEGRDSLEGQKLKEHIETTKVFRVLLEQQPITANVLEDVQESGTDPIYTFSIVVKRVCERLGYEEEAAVSKLRDFAGHGYVTLLPFEKESATEQEIEENNYDKTGIQLNKPKIMDLLIDDSIMLGERIEKLMDSIQRMSEFQSAYGSPEEIAQKHQEIEKLYSDAETMKSEWEKARDADKAEREKQAEELKSEVVKIAETKAKKTAEETAQSISADEIGKALGLSGKIGAAMQDMQKDIIQYMGIFIAIFALIGLNLGRTESWSISNFFHMNLVITASMATLLSFISVLMEGKSPRTRIMGVLTVVLWIAAVFVFFVFPYLRDEIISFWATYDR